jgi:hypothetical protein
MADTFVFAVQGLDTLEIVEEKSKTIKLEAIQAVNRVTRDARAQAERLIASQVNFGPGYLSPAAKRLYVSKQATRTSPEAVITARGRPTSLARFATSRGVPGELGVTVQVHPGKAKFLKRAFLIKLRAGDAGIETKYNLGLAVRLKHGDTLANKRFVRQLASGLYLLYGPSVSQVFLDNQEEGVAKDMEPSILDNLTDEFLRLLDLKNG